MDNDPLERTGSEITRCVVCDSDADAHPGATAIHLPCGAQMHPQCSDWFYAGSPDATACPRCNNNHVVVV